MGHRKKGALLAKPWALLWGSTWLIIASTSAASTVVALELEELAAAADVIVLGEVVATRGERLHGRIVTRATVRIDMAVAGLESPMDRIEVMVPGGELDGLGMMIPGAPRLRPGDRRLLFLQHTGGELWIMGLSQGAFPVHDGGDAPPTVEPPRELPQLVRMVDGRLESARPALMRTVPLQVVLARVSEVRRGLR